MLGKDLIVYVFGHEEGAGFSVCMCVPGDIHDIFLPMPAVQNFLSSPPGGDSYYTNTVNDIMKP